MSYCNLWVEIADSAEASEHVKGSKSKVISERSENRLFSDNDVQIILLKYLVLNQLYSH